LYFRTLHRRFDWMVFGGHTTARAVYVTVPLTFRVHLPPMFHYNNRAKIDQKSRKIMIKKLLVWCVDPPKDRVISMFAGLFTNHDCTHSPTMTEKLSHLHSFWNDVTRSYVWFKTSSEPSPCGWMIVWVLDRWASEFFTWSYENRNWRLPLSTLRHRLWDSSCSCSLMQSLCLWASKSHHHNDVVDQQERVRHLRPYSQ
jgi:hypothetical protein